MDGPADYFLPETGEAQARLAGEGDYEDGFAIGAGMPPESVAVTAA